MNERNKTERFFIDFFTQCNDFNKKLRDFFINFLSSMNEYNILKEIQDKKEKLPIPFNILKIFDNHRYETKNSKLIKHILNTEVANKYLVTDFIQFLDKKFGWTLSKYDISTIENETEYIDIFIQGENFSLIIENKIYAKDQPEQIKRYVTTVKEFKSKDIYVIYLTPQGHEPSENSLPKELRYELGNRFKKLKHGDIGHWIETLLEKDEYACLKTNQKYKYLYSALIQFMDTELLLSNMTQEDNVTKEVIKELLLNKIPLNENEKSIAELEEYRDVFFNAASVIDEVITLKNFIKDNQVERHLDFVFNVINIIKNYCDKEKLEYIEHKYVKNFETYRQFLFDNFNIDNYPRLLEITVNPKLPQIIIEVCCEELKFYSYFGMPNNTDYDIIVLEDIFKTKFKEYDLDKNSNEHWKFWITFSPFDNKSVNDVSNEIIKLCKLCREEN
ncbi:PD-(D/E)XK nuclease family protein [Treponema pedis]|uniref:PD-(D/E)XK nuclease family protein n=1 Tax=Treponema pedis TaxID=409322 RepID=UPI0004194CB6|nr:PD-(D/E)XK nuclease family protein [Treponema pedis]